MRKERLRVKNEKNNFEEKKIFGIFWNVFIFGFVSFFNDFLSELIIRVFFFFLKNVLNVKIFVIGFIEGVVDLIVIILKIFLGYFLDKLN